MATLNAGDIKSTTQENALLEAAMKLQIKERDTASNPNNKNNVNVQINTDSGTATITATLSVIQVVNSTTGAIEFKAEEYLT